jgi:hypothetical protein
MKRFLHVSLAMLLLSTAACSGAGGATATAAPGAGDALEGGVLATFDVTGEAFTVWVTNPATIEQLLALERGESTANIPNGRLLRGAGEADHNAPWSWHLDPEDIEMAEITIELCDGAPSYVEDNVAEFADNIGRYCPWSAQLVALEDRR